MIRAKAAPLSTTRATRTTTPPTNNQASVVMEKKKKPLSAPRDGSRARQSNSRSDKDAPPTVAVATSKKNVADPPTAGLTRAKPSPPNNNQLEKTTAPPVVKMHGLPSASLNKHKQADPWSTKKKSKTNFGASYQAGNIPCRINHGGIKNSLQWNTPPEELDYNPLLVTCCEGFLETDHPFVFLARQGFQDLMGANGADDKVRPLLGLLIPPIRGALMATDDDVITVALHAIQLVSEAVGGDMNVHLAKLIQQVHRKYTNKALKGPIDQTLAALERNGGSEALRIIRSKIPTYVSLA
ncbi:hypothetical protein H310_12414 [Aphanomyces invadans]|uniref:PACRG-like protein n=1 Tax=Aphanomyces invadans TaxID=157072 RepID=A0A024THU4_9STRA|nr:hypothetical protein H310_12414 [Aphanomyces invadans]ETV93633.1 hypothetical protein H310_12414 [Aphanomyces invadans]|eukprot:XP_008877674.1 hypothetical protein H310_12414 [Aphanomyces invadans]